MNLRLSLSSLCLALIAPATLHAQFSDGVLDTSFDVDGIVQTDFGPGQPDSVYAVAAQADGMTVVAGRSDVGGNGQVALARYTKTGALDAGFGSGGRVLTDVGSVSEAAYAVKVQPDGKIVVAGFSSGSSLDFLVLRYTPAGVLDGTFGSGGIVTIPFGGDWSVATSLALQDDGKIVVAGNASIEGNERFAVVRLTDAGLLDATFSGDGIATVDFGPGRDNATSVAVQSDGMIVLAGGRSLYSFSNNGDFALARLTTTGELDGTFGTGGKVITSVISGEDMASSVVIQTSGEIIAAGTALDGFNSSFALVRYTPSGALDATFGTSGIVLTSISGSSYAGCSGLALQSDGKIIAAGTSQTTHNNFATVRYTSTGALDTSFGTGGIATTDAYATCKAVALHADGRIALAGRPDNSPVDFYLAMYRVPSPDIAVARGTALTDGVGSIPFGVVPVGSSSSTLTFTITNPGTAQLNNLAITKTGADAADFIVSALSGTSIPSGGGSVTFTVTFTPATGGAKTADLQIASNVSGTKNPFDIALTATALGTGQDSDNDGLNDLAEYQLAALGFDWQVAQPSLVETFFATASGAGLFQSSQVQALKLPTPQIQRHPLTGEFTLSVGMEKSATLDPAVFSPFAITAPQISINDGKLEIRFPGQDDAAFYRLSSQ